jgi:hypothetical protein
LLIPENGHQQASDALANHYLFELFLHYVHCHYGLHRKITKQVPVLATLLPTQLPSLKMENSVLFIDTQHTGTY